MLELSTGRKGGHITDKSGARFVPQSGALFSLMSSDLFFLGTDPTRVSGSHRVSQTK